MSLFGNVDSQGMEEAVDSLGGGNHLKESGIYIAEIVVAYVTESKNGAQEVNLELKLEDGSDYRETLYVTNRNKQTFFEKDGKRIPLPGFTRVNDICLVCTGEEMVNQGHEFKTLALYDYESKKEVPREVPVLVDLVGTTVAVAIQKIRENKTTKNESTNKYEPTNEPREKNEIVAVFHPELKQTVREAQDERDADFWDKWLEKNEGQTYDKFKEVTGSAGGASKARTASTSSAPARKSVFGKKQ